MIDLLTANSFYFSVTACQSTSEFLAFWGRAFEKSFLPSVFSLTRRRHEVELDDHEACRPGPVAIQPAAC